MVAGAARGRMSGGGYIMGSAPLRHLCHGYATAQIHKRTIGDYFEILPRQALHAKTIGFIHPETKESISFDSKIPNDISQVIDKWELYSKHKKL